MELSAVDKRDSRRAAAMLEERREKGRIAGNNNRLLQLHAPRRGFTFDERRQQIFLDFFAGTADEDAAADAAGVSRQTVRALIRRNPEFAALREEALQHAYALLEGEAVRQRLAVAQRLRDNLEPTGDPSTGSGQGLAQEFERVMKLLARYDRKDGRVASREHKASPTRVWSFEDSIKALDKALDSLGARRAPFPPALEDGSGGGPGDCSGDG
jgi:transposase